LVTIDVSDKVHLEASLAKPKLPPPPNKNHTSSSSSSSAGAAAGEAEREGGEGREAYHYHSNSNSGAARRARNAKVGVVITHPHPMLGGNMHNNVVVALFKRFASSSSINYLFIYNWSFIYLFFNIFHFVGSHRRASVWCGSTSEARAAPPAARPGEVLFFLLHYIFYIFLYSAFTPQPLWLPVAVVRVLTADDLCVVRCWRVSCVVCRVPCAVCRVVRLVLKKTIMTQGAGRGKTWWPSVDICSPSVAWRRCTWSGTPTARPSAAPL